MYIWVAGICKLSGDTKIALVAYTNVIDLRVAMAEKFNMDYTPIQLKQLEEKPNDRRQNETSS